MHSLGFLHQETKAQHQGTPPPLPDSHSTHSSSQGLMGNAAYPAAHGALSRIPAREASRSEGSGPPWATQRVEWAAVGLQKPGSPHGPPGL